MTDTSQAGQYTGQPDQPPGDQAGEQTDGPKGQIAAGLYLVSQNVELAQIPADAEDEPAGEEGEQLA
jgi:hypothetical protein